jgi:hypothetical protein
MKGVQYPEAADIATGGSWDRLWRYLGSGNPGLRRSSVRYLWSVAAMTRSDLVLGPGAHLAVGATAAPAALQPHQGDGNVSRMGSRLEAMTDV